MPTGPRIRGGALERCHRASGAEPTCYPGGNCQLTCVHGASPPQPSHLDKGFGHSQKGIPNSEPSTALWLQPAVTWQILPKPLTPAPPAELPSHRANPTPEKINFQGQTTDIPTYSSPAPSSARGWSPGLEGSQPGVFSWKDLSTERLTPGPRPSQ